MDMGFARLLPRIIDSLVSLLENGGDREPDIIEQVYSMILEMLLWGYLAVPFFFGSFLSSV